MTWKCDAKRKLTGLVKRCFVYWLLMFFICFLGEGGGGGHLFNCFFLWFCFWVLLLFVWFFWRGGGGLSFVLGVFLGGGGEGRW